MSVDYAPLLILAVVVVGGIVVFAYLRRLKRAAVQALEAARQVQASMESYRATMGIDQPLPNGDDKPRA